MDCVKCGGPIKWKFTHSGYEAGGWLNMYCKNGVHWRRRTPCNWSISLVIDCENKEVEWE